MKRFIVTLILCILASGTAIADQVSTVAPRRLYVETTGNDINPCTKAKPCLTIQGALKKLPKRIRHPQRITVGVGTFAGALVEGFSIETELGNTDSTYPAWLTIEGTLSAYTPATGLQTGTVASFTAESATAFGTATVTGAGWTVNDLAGRIFHTTGGTGSGQYLMVVSNTATVVTFAGTVSTMDATTTFEIVTPGTLINATPTGFSSVGGLNFNGGVLNEPATINSGVTTTPILVRYLRFSTTTYCVLWRTPFIRATFENIRCESIIGMSTNFNATTNVTINRSAFINSTLTTVAGLMTVSGNYLQANSGNFSIQVASYSQVSSDRNYFVANGAVPLVWVGSGKWVSTRDRASSGGSDCVIVGGRTAYAQRSAGGWADLTNSDFSGCSGNAVIVDGHGSFVHLKTVTGTGSTGYGILARNNGVAEIESDVTITGTGGDLSVDGSAITYAALRAASPKSYFGMSYGSLIYER